MRARGKHGLFTAAPFRTERMSCLIPSHGGVEGILSQINSHKGCRYKILELALLFYPRYFSVTRNELQSFGTGKAPINVDLQKNRTLRTTTLLAGKPRKMMNEFGEEEIVSGVDYIVTFQILAPDIKYITMFESRLRNGKFYGTQPYMGMREFSARLDPVEDFRSISYPLNQKMIEHPNGLRTANVNENLGISFYGTDWDDPAHPNYFAPLEVVKGIVKYPSWSEVRKLGIKREAA